VFVHILLAMTAPKPGEARREIRGSRPAKGIAGRRLRLQIDQRRAQLIEMGIDLFSRHPYENISIDGLAEMANISKGLLYHYFGSKRDFYVETVRAASRRLRLLTAPDPALPPAARLRAAVDAHLRYIQEHGAVYSAVYRSGLAIAPEIQSILEEHRAIMIHYILQALGVTKARPLLLAGLRAWVAMVEGASLEWIADPSVTRDDLRELLVAGYAGLLLKTLELDPKISIQIPSSTKDSPG
jgi:AcrR family transcriptional regulator